MVKMVPMEVCYLEYNFELYYYIHISQFSISQCF